MSRTGHSEAVLLCTVNCGPTMYTKAALRGAARGGNACYILVIYKGERVFQSLFVAYIYIMYLCNDNIVTVGLPATPTIMVEYNG